MSLCNGGLMPNKREKAHRKEILHAVREDERRKVRNSLPAAVPVLKALFSYVDLQVRSVECDHTLRHVRDFIRSQGLPEDAVVGWLKNNGGYCDCEALMNAEQVVQEAVPGYDDLAPTLVGSVNSGPPNSGNSGPPKEPHKR